MVRTWELINDDEAAYGPSHQDGLSDELVFKYSRSSCIFIQKVAERLRLRLITICSAKVFFWRYFSKQSFKTHDRIVVSITCIFLACKVEEDLRKLKEVIITAHSVKTGEDERISERDERFKRLSDKVLVCERILLHTLSFDVNIVHPHNVSLKFVKKLQGGARFRQTVWNFMNDSSNTNLCLRYSAEQIAAAGILLASHYLKIRTREKDEESDRAIQNLEKEMKANDDKLFGFTPVSLKGIASELLRVYEAPEELFKPDNKKRGSSSSKPNAATESKTEAQSKRVKTS